MPNDVFNLKVVGFYKTDNRRIALSTFASKLKISEKRALALLQAKATIKKNLPEEDCVKLKGLLEGIGIASIYSKVDKFDKELRSVEDFSVKEEPKVKEEPNSSESSAVPIEVKYTTKDKKKACSKKQSINSKKSHAKLLSYGVFLLIFLVSVVGFIKTSSDPVPEWTESQKASLCKYYVGSIFSKSPRIIYHYRTDSNGLVYVKYNRPSDDSTWKYVCEINKNSMRWAAFSNFTGDWGRWRNEDRVSISYSSDSDEAYFVSTNKKKISVSFGSRDRREESNYVNLNYSNYPEINIELSRKDSLELVFFAQMHFVCSLGRDDSFSTLSVKNSSHLSNGRYLVSLIKKAEIDGRRLSIEQISKISTLEFRIIQAARNDFSKIKENIRFDQGEALIFDVTSESEITFVHGMAMIYAKEFKIDIPVDSCSSLAYYAKSKVDDLIGY